MEPTHDHTLAVKPLSRLRLRAPPSLDLDLCSAAAAAADSVAVDEASIAIPLLSPLAPSPFPETAPATVEGGEERRRDGGVVQSPSGGWQHPAMPAPGDPSSLGCFLQSQCLIVDPAQ